MERSPASSLISWILLPVAAYLMWSALSLPWRAYTGLALRGDLVASVDPRSPGERAGVVAGDRLSPAGTAGVRGAERDPLRSATPGAPIRMLRQRNGEARAVWIAPESLPAMERGVSAGLLLAASIFVLLGGWVWSERRDPLTRSFFLLCVSFGGLLAPRPSPVGAAGSLAGDLLLTGISLYLPALFVHFFATFPEARPRAGRRAWIRAFYTIASVQLGLVLAATIAERAGAAWARRASDSLQVAAAVWFAMGLGTALTLFVLSYRGAGSSDARRRLRVALAGTLIGIVPFATLVVLRNVSPGMAVPGDRWVAALPLFVPACFAWAIVVHRVFDVRVALRAAVVTGIVAAACVGAYVLGEWWTHSWNPGAGMSLAGGALALVALTASLAGPAAPLLRTLGARVVPDEESAPLSGWIHASPGGVPADGDAVLAQACAVVERYLRLDGCSALAARGDEVAVVLQPGHSMPEPGPELRTRALLLDTPGIQGVDEAPLARADREALRIAGVAWLLPVGDNGSRAVLLLGRRIAGPWLSRREGVELDRFARQLAIALENADLRREATSHGALTREMREAGRVQAHLLPQRVPVRPTLDCAAAVLSTEPVGGDYYDFVEGPDRSFTLAVGDVAGHGLPAALLLSHVQAHFRSQASGGATPGRILAALNRELIEFDQPQKFVGLVCAHVDARRGRVWIANAGLTPPMVRRAAGPIEEISASGVLLGVRRESTYTDVCVELGSGDALVLYTDGLTEAQRGDELFGPDRLKAVLGRETPRRAVDLLDALLREVRGYADRPLDDLTIVVLRQLTQAAAGVVPLTTR